MSYPNRRQHVGVSAGPEPRVAPTIADVGIPPLPLPSHVAIVDSRGRPTMEYYQWQMKVHDWRMKLFAHLGGIV